MKDNILVSISCTTFNHEKYIEKALCGFLMQRVTFQYEILIHDDASVDNTVNIIKKYEKLYPDIIKPIYQSENQWSKGVCITQTYQYPRARGKYIAICEGDDYWIDPLKLQKQVNYLEEHQECSFCCHNAFVLRSDRAVTIFNDIFEERDLSLREIMIKWIIPTASFVLRKEVLINYPEWTKEIYSGDLTMSLIATTFGTIHFFPDIMSVYRYNVNNSSFSTIYRKQSEFIHSQHILLYNLFNKYTNYQHKEVIENVIKEKDLLFNFQLSYKKNPIWAMIKYPRLFFGKVYTKIH